MEMQYDGDRPSKMHSRPVQADRVVLHARPGDTFLIRTPGLPSKTGESQALMQVELSRVR